MKFKYIDRYWKKGRWNYVYPKDTTDKNSNRPFVGPKNIMPGIGQNKLSINNRYINKATAATSKQSKVINKVDNILKKMGGTSLSKASKTVEKGESFVFKKIDKLYNMRKKEFQNKRESGYAADAKAKTEAAQKKLAETKSKVESEKRHTEFQNKRESGYAADAKAKTEAQNAKLIEARTNKRADGYAKDAAYKELQRLQRMKQKPIENELKQYDKSETQRKIANTMFGLDKLKIIDRKNVGSTKEETSKINPDYDPTNPATSENCGFCAVAWVLRKKGYDVEAKQDLAGDWNDGPHGTTGTYDAQREKMFIDPINSIHTTYDGKKTKTKVTPTEKTNVIADELQNVNQYTSSSQYKDVVDIMYNKYGDLDRKTFEKHAEEIILKESKNNDYGMLAVNWVIGGGHALNYQVENGKVMVYDGQVNESYPLSELLPKVSNLRYMDCTSLVPTDNVNLVVQNRRKR